jgi:hypothetical protein
LAGLVEEAEPGKMLGLMNRHLHHFPTTFGRPTSSSSISTRPLKW